MAQPMEHLSPWHQAAMDNCDLEPNPVITPYKEIDAKVLHDEDGLTIKKRLVTMQDGEQYWVTSSDLSKRRSKGIDDIAHYEGVAFTLHPEGLYVERLKKLAEIGFSGSVFSVPENKGLWISYDKNVHNYLSLANNEALEHDRDPHLVNLSGISQGSMNGFGFIEQAPAHAIHVASAHLSVPCLPDGITWEHKKYIAGHAIETLTKMPFEIIAIAKIIKNMTPEEREALLPTVDLRKEALIVQGQMLPSLLSGGTGKAARNLDENLPVMVELNGLDALSRDKRWINSYLGDKPNVKIRRRKRGVHGDVVNPISQTNWVGYQTAVGEILSENPYIRSNPRTAGAEVLKIMRIEFPQYAKPLKKAAA